MPTDFRSYCNLAEDAETTRVLDDVLEDYRAQKIGAPSVIPELNRRWFAKYRQAQIDAWKAGLNDPEYARTMLRLMEQ